LGLGWTKGIYRMIGSEAVIGQVKNGVATIKFYSLNGISLSDIKPISVPLYSLYGEYIDGTTTIIFTRDINSGNNPVNLNSDSLIGAYGPSPDLGEHIQYSKELTVVDYLDGSSTQQIDLGHRVMNLFHGILMVFSLAILAPVASMVARYGKDQPNDLWFQAHRNTQISSTCIAVLAFIIALLMVDGSHFEFWHGQFGVAIVAWIILQTLSGILRPHKPEGTIELPRARKIFNFVHPLSGLLLMVGSIIQIFGGLLMVGVSSLWIGLFGAALLIEIGIAVALEVRQRYCHRSPTTKFQRVDTVEEKVKDDNNIALEEL